MSQNSKRERGVSPGGRGKTASEGARHAAGGPATGEGAPTSGSSPGASGSDISATTQLATISPSVDDSPEFNDAPLHSYKPVAGPGNWDGVRLPSVRNVGKNADGKVIPHSRSEEVARVVAELSLSGTPLNTIAAILNIRPGQLKEHYPNELAHTRTLADARVASTAYAMAIRGDDPTMTKFVAKARLKWRDGDVADAGGSLFNNIHIHVGD